MTNKKTTKRSLLVSLLALMLCFSMLIGTTFAWFTDSTANTNNIIASGTLDVKMSYSPNNTNFKDVEDADATPIFNYDNWEPGYTDMKYIKIENMGSLAFMWQLYIVPNGLVENLAHVIDVYVAEVDDTFDHDALDVTSADTFTKVGTLYDMIKENDGAAHGALLAKNSPADPSGYEREGSVTMCIAFHMREDAGNEYMDKSIGTTFDLKLIAKQYTEEKDSFNDQYDVNATYPSMGIIKISEATLVDIEIPVDNVTVTLPAGVEAGVYTLNVSNEFIETNTQTNKTTISYDIDLRRDGDKLNGTECEVEINIGVLFDIDKLDHNGTEITEYEYDPMTGVLTFKTTSFSPFDIYASNLATGAEIVDGKIVAGTFTVNPVTLDPSLGEADSEYIAINYVQGGKTMYVVDDRATTKVLAAPDTADYVAENGNYEVTTLAYNGLYSQLTSSATTVYLLPGTYECATILTISSSMEMTGLGDKADINIVKVFQTGAKKKNNHLINCTNGVSYIQVVLRNFTATFDAPDWTWSGAPIQSIRMAKVKCYDISVFHDQYGAFFVNANNTADDGNKYPAYMYVENCTSNASAYSSSGSSWYLYYTNLTHQNGKEYTTTIGSKLVNQYMAPDDWDWEN